MFRFYREYYAPTRSRLVSFAVYAGIAVKLVLSVARNALRGATGDRQPRQTREPHGAPPRREARFS
jgi:hypothetical protein